MTMVALNQVSEEVEVPALPATGVSLHLDGDMGEFWIDVALDHDPEHLASVVDALPLLGFEMDDSGSDDMDADGTLRTYLVEVNNDDDNEYPALRLA